MRKWNKVSIREWMSIREWSWEKWTESGQRSWGNQMKANRRGQGSCMEASRRGCENRMEVDRWVRGNHMETDRRIRVKGILAAVCMAVLAVGCGGETDTPGVRSAWNMTEGSNTEKNSIEENIAEENSIKESSTDGAEDGDGTAGNESSMSEGTGADRADGAGTGTGIAEETANDASIDFAALKVENPEIFGWLHIPDTTIDAPILQSAETDDYYETHNAMKEVDEGGALYIEAANLSSMCDFNTVIHGKTAEDGESGLFADLYQFADPDFFDSHEQMYVYLDGNVLTYEIFAAYERENTSLLRTYDFTYIAGCDQFLEDLYGIRDMSMMLRTGWDEVTPYHFLVTLTATKGDNPDRQFVVLAALIEDPAGNIDRAVWE